MHPFQQNKSLSEYSSFGIGGLARYFSEVTSIEQLQQVLIHCQQEKLPFHVIGKGSNSLFDDRGFNGVVILNKICFYEKHNQVVSVGAGFSFSLLGVKTAREGLSGLEFASGIPASVGGAIFMNAGANGVETADTLLEVTFIDAEGDVNVYSRDEMTFSYRHSIFHEKKGVIAAAKFQLTPCEQARQKQLGIIAYRTKTQPYGDKSCGCIFRNPKGENAGALIESCGLKGREIGGAKVSELHANFIINKKGATAQDVLKLAQLIQQNVKKQTGIKLEFELKLIPFE